MTRARSLAAIARIRAKREEKRFWKCFMLVYGLWAVGYISLSTYFSS